MPIKRVRTREPRLLSTEQKVAFGILLFLGLGGVLLGFRSFGATINRPFDLQIAQYLKGEKFLTSSQREAQDLEASKTRDVDGDGLMDYDELYVYKTSPYITDSDSDGFDDKMEVFSGNDPNCPKDTECKSGASEEVTTQTVLPGLASTFGAAQDILGSGAVDFNSPKDVEAFFLKATIGEIRQALLEAGVDEETLANIPDDQLQEFFESTVKEAGSQGTFDELAGEQTAE